MPGPVSDSYDLEFSTSSNREDVSEAIQEVVSSISDLIGPELKWIVGVVQGGDGVTFTAPLSERELRIIRFGLNRALESI